MASIYDTVHVDYGKKIKEWEQITDCLEGEKRIKERGNIYLPFPIALDDDERGTDDFKNQYSIYLSGAHYVNFTEQAVEDLVSGVFRQKPMIDKIPKELEYFKIPDFTKEAVELVTAYGRALALVDYPTVNGNISKADEEENNIRAYAVLYKAEDVLDWKTERINGNEVLTMVLLREIVYTDEVDDDESNQEWLYRKLELINGVYTVSTQTETEETATVYEPMADGKKLSHIPATFIGAKNNKPDVDNSPVIGISNSNIKHYQTWAELIHIQTYMGHPMLAITGAPKGFVKEMEKNNIKMNVGASNALVLEGETADASVLTTANGTNIMHFDTLKELQASMQEQGARIKSGTTSQVESAEALELKFAGDNSLLASIAINVELATLFVLEQMALFMGVQLGDVKVRLNKTFFEKKPDANVAQMLNSGVSSGNLPNRIYLKYLQDTNIIDADEDLEALATEAQDSNPFAPNINGG